MLLSIMKCRQPIAVFLGLALALSVWANTAIEPESRGEKWEARHEAFLEVAKGQEIEVLFLGDSITDFWRRDSPNGGMDIWKTEYAPLKAANFGISGDRTQHVLWRIEHGELDNIDPKVVVLMIGTNNTGFERDSGQRRNTVPETIAGVAAVVDAIQAKLPNAEILLLSIFPRGQAIEDPQRQQVEAINAGIAKLGDKDGVRWLDIYDSFLGPDGTLSADIMPDYLHPNSRGYEIWADAIREPLRALLNAAPTR